MRICQQRQLTDRPCSTRLTADEQVTPAPPPPQRAGESPQTNQDRAASKNTNAKP
jgi:hypothetical protein